MFIQGNISLRVRKPFGAVVATSGEVPGLISKNCHSEAAFSEAPGFGFSPGGQPTDLIRTTIQARRASECVVAARSSHVLHSMSMDARSYLPDEPAAAALPGSETHSLARRACITGSMKQRRDHRFVLQACREWRLQDPLRG
jgi:hypothetical protein